jgi:hypothetical protein
MGIYIYLHKVTILFNKSHFIQSKQDFKPTRISNKIDKMGLDVSHRFKLLAHLFPTSHLALQLHLHYL